MSQQPSAISSKGPVGTLSPTARSLAQQPVVKVQLHSAGAASRLAALLLVQILPVFSLVAPGHPGASPASVQRRTFTTDCYDAFSCYAGHPAPMAFARTSKAEQG